MQFSLSRDRYLILFAVIPLLLCFRVNAEGRDLGEILAQVEQHTPALQAARARTEVQQAAKKQAKSRYLGEVDALTAHINVATVSINAGRTAPVERLRLIADKEAVK